MNQPFGSQPAVPFAFLLLAFTLPLQAGPSPAAGGAPLGRTALAETPSSGTPDAAKPAAEASPGKAAAPASEAAPVPVSVSHTGPTPEQRLLIPPRAFRLKGPRPPAPLKRLTYSAREGFALRMVSNQDVTAEIRNGAGRTLAYTARNLEAGDWTLRPRNLAPGLYTVFLRTGPNLRVLRLEIQDAERGQGGPEWVLEKAADSTLAPGVLPRGARSTPAYVPAAELLRLPPA